MGNLKMISKSVAMKSKVGEQSDHIKFAKVVTNKLAGSEMTTMLEQPARDDFATLAEYKTAMLEYLEKFTELTILGIQKKTGRTMPQDQKLALRNKATIAESETDAKATAVAEEPKKRRRRRRKRNKATIAESETIAAKATSAKATAVAEEPKKRRRRRKRRQKRKTSQTVTAELTF